MLLGQIDGRTGAAVKAWVAVPTSAFRAGIEVVAIEPPVGYAAAARAPSTIFDRAANACDNLARRAHRVN